MRDSKDTPRPAANGQAGRDRLAAIVRDPGTVFLYWELNGPRSAEAVRALGDDCCWCLRVLNLTDGSSATTPVEPEARNHYMEVTPGATYGFELAATSNERWRSVCRTERVEVPPAEPALKTPRREPEPAAGAGRRRTPAIEVAGLRFETTAAHMGSSSRARPPAEVEAKPRPEGE